MKNSALILLIFTFGIVIGKLLEIPKIFLTGQVSTYILYILIFLVGITAGSDMRSFLLIKQEKFKVLLLPLVTIFGTLAGVLSIAMIFPEVTIKDSLAVGAGFGYYSVSSIMITKLVGTNLGIIALLANILRELITLVFTPVMVKVFGKFSPVSAGGATSMDTTLPVITKFSGKEFTMIAIFHGTILTILVPVITSLILN